MTTTRNALAKHLVSRRITTADELAPFTLVWGWLDGNGAPVRAAGLALPAVAISAGDHARAGSNWRGQAGIPAKP